MNVNKEIIKKICSKCKIEKLFIEFSKIKNCKYGINSICKCCTNEYSRNVYNKNKEIIQKAHKEYNNINKEKLKVQKKKYRIKNQDIIKEVRKKYLNNNRDKIKNQHKEYFIKNKEDIYKYRKNRRILNLNCKILDVLRSRLYKVIKTQCGTKNKRTLELLGCSVEFFKEHLEKQFKDGMTWENHSYYGWHIDHIRPCASFDLGDPRQQEACFHYTNMQPLWWDENFKKGATYNV